jgi:hypothetical protein
MKPELKGRITVALVISLIAFGFGTAADIFVGSNNNTSQTLNLTQQQEDLPSLPASTTTRNVSQNQNAQYTPSQQVYVENNNQNSQTNSASNNNNFNNKNNKNNNSTNK